MIQVCVAGVTGWTGKLVTKSILASDEFRLVGAISRQQAGRDAGEVLDQEAAGVTIAADLADIENVEIDVMIDYTSPQSVKDRVMAALKRGIRVVIGTSGLTAADYEEIEASALMSNLGVIAAGNFSITAALAKHFALTAAKYLPSWEIVDYAHASKVDAPSGTVRELAETIGAERAAPPGLSIDQTHGIKEARGATIGGTQVHSIRLPSYVIAFETIFGLPDERLTIRHDAGPGAEPYVAGTLEAARKVGEVRGLVRGLDRLLFATGSPAPETI